MAGLDRRLVMPDRPSIAVLPFASTGSGYEAQAFAESVTDHILYTLACMPALFVTGRDSAFTFKGRTVALRAIGQQLGVAHILSGTADQSDESVSVTARLSETESGRTLWSQDFRGGTETVLAFQSAIIGRVVATMAPGMFYEASTVARSRISGDVGIYRKFLSAYSNHSGDSEDSVRTMLASLRSISEQVPEHPVPPALMSQCYANLILQGMSRDASADAAAGLRLAEAALARTAEDPSVLMLAAYSLAFLGRQYDRAVSLLDRSLALNPNSASAYERSGWVRCYVGEPALAARHFRLAKRLSPLDRVTFRFDSGLGLALCMLGQHDEAVSWLRRALADMPGWTGTYRALAASLAHLGRGEEARRATRDLLALDPGYRIGGAMRQYLPSAGKDIVVEGMRKAGVPD